jgi:hypothetical protein
MQRAVSLAPGVNFIFGKPQVVTGFLGSEVVL